MTGLVYARHRWIDPRTGTFLTPDPQGYGDSSNLYAFAGGDPVNGRDPTGEITIVVHGTSARDALWWNTGSFARSLDAQVGDVWEIATAGGKPVSKVDELTRRFGPDGRFSWSGGNAPRDRMEGAERLADYINTIRRLYPGEPIRVVTHSHGGNVATGSTSGDLISSPAMIDQLVVIAKPYFSAEPRVFKAFRDRQTFYDPDVTHIRSSILSISSPEDDIQKAAAERGAFERTGVGYGPVQSTRRIQTPGLASKFIDVEVRTGVGWYDAHGVLHNSVMGTAIGIYLRNGGNSAADWAGARALARVPKVITNDKDKGD